MPSLSNPGYEGLAFFKVSSSKTFTNWLIHVSLSHPLISVALLMALILSFTIVFFSSPDNIKTSRCSDHALKPNTDWNNALKVLYFHYLTFTYPGPSSRR